MRTIRALALNIATMALLFVILFIFAEAVVRIFWLFPGPRWTDHPLLGTIMIPHSRSVIKGPGYTTLIDVNSYGFRDSEYPKEKSPGTLRIAFIGDSLVESGAVDIKNRFDKILEGKFSEESLKVEVLDFGVGGYGTDQEYLAYTSIVREFNPDIVVLVFAFNDFRNNVKSLEQSPNKPYFHLEGGSLVYEPPRFNYNPRLRRIIDRSFILTELANTVVAKLKSLKMQEQTDTEVPPSFEVFLDSPPPEYWEATTITRALLKQFSEAVTTDNRKFILTYPPPRNLIHPEFEQELRLQYPALQELKYDYLEEERFLAETAQDYNITLIMTTEHFKMACTTPCFVDMAHMNTQGNRVFAESLFPGLRDEALKIINPKKANAQV